MNKIFKLLIISIIAIISFAACSKKQLTLDENTSMKTLLNANDEDIKNLVVEEVTKNADLSAEDVDVEYVLRDKKSQAIAVKIKIKDGE